jgi:hypothetical protein
VNFERGRAKQCRSTRMSRVAIRMERVVIRSDRLAKWRGRRDGWATGLPLAPERKRFMQWTRKTGEFRLALPKKHMFRGSVGYIGCEAKE